MFHLHSAIVPTACRCAAFGCALGLFASTMTARAEVIGLIITLDGDQEPMPVDTPASGMGTATFDTDTNLFEWNFTFEDLGSEQTAAHFHGPATLCVNGPIEVPLPMGSPVVGSETLDAGQAADLLAGLWYVNVHTVEHPSGEIRGQVVPGPLEDPIPASIPMGGVHIQPRVTADLLTAPNWGTVAPGDASRLFVTDQPGTLWAIDLATGAKTVFLDVAPLLVDLGVFGPDSFDERGLLGVAFHPDYQANGLLYTYTSEHVFKPADFSTMPEGVAPNHRSVIREWQVPNPADPASVVDPATSRALMRIDEPQFNHNAGGLGFGPDGLLYATIGDGGGADDKDGQISLGMPIVGHGCIGNGQNGETILGTVIRIDPLGSDSANGQYGIPKDNPFVGDGDPRLDEIFAMGLRNPFRLSFDRLTGDLWVPDVGQGHIEEINTIIPGGNYGWNQKEGTFAFVPNGNERGHATDRDLAVTEGLIDPIAQYDHDEGIAIVGGFVYRGTKIPSLQGRYVFGDFALTFSNDGRLFYLDEKNQVVEFPLVGQKEFGMSLLGFGEDADGELYVLANGTGTPFGETGVVLKIATKRGDLDADGQVGFADILLLLGQWGPCDGCPGDIDEDGQAGFSDILIVLKNWG